MDEETTKTGKEGAEIMTTFAIATLGCKVNTYESQGYESARCV